MIIDPYRCTKTSSHTCRPQSTFPRGSRAPFSRHVCHSVQTSEKRILNQKTLSNSHFNPIPYTALLSPFCLSLSFWISFPLSPSLARRRLFQWLSRSCTGWCSCPFPAPASSCSTSCSTQSSTSPPEQTSPNMSEAETFRQKRDPEAVRTFCERGRLIRSNGVRTSLWSAVC